MKRGTSILGLLSLVLAAAGSAGTSSELDDKCLAFDPRDLVPNSSVTVREFVPAGTNITFPYNDPSCNRASQLVAANLCRIALSVPTSNRSGVVFELWLPEIWNGRTLATGNGGIDGCIKYEDIAYGAANGFSRYASHPRNSLHVSDKLDHTFGSNNGHNGTSGDAFYQKHEVVIDYSWRALHTSVGLGKQLTASFYNTSTAKSYYIGCSLGGRQGIGSAEKFPKDFDGIVAGAPATDFNDLYSWRASFFPLTGAANSTDFVSAETWKTTVHDEVLAQCDEIDGVLDGIIEDPTLCHFDTRRLLCSAKAMGTNTTSCLTEPQVQTVEAVYSDYLWPNGTLLYPRPNPGNEILAADGLYSGKSFSPSVDWFKFVVLQNPAWDPASYSVNDALLAAQTDPAEIRTWPSSLAPFKEKGGKILSFHGQQDQQITSLNSARFYRHLASGMGYDADHPDELSQQMDEFYRLFRVPGMNHCSGGPGAWAIGQGGSEAAYTIPFDGTHNVLAAMVDWVENGVPPDTILGTKFVNDTPSAGVAYRHRHCKYPYRSTFDGVGNPLNESSWDCINFGLA
ncbi:tannase and feruloyl esterase [Xylariaceae sp. FL0016]|nr:tannase and feruloyl esterase [Xylariaceae sp. FL0016]